ncbi:MAG: GNAT family N-acetyltransferase, partial [Candidatus Limnocylindrales bacterium]
HCRRGPISGGLEPAIAAARATALAARLRAEGVASLTVDPELPASPAYEAAMDRAGFRRAPEAQPSIHLMRLELPPGTTEATLLAGCSKSTRQRIRSASAAGVRVRTDATGAALEEFALFLVATAERRGFELRPEAGYLAWWRRLLAAGQARLFVADLDGRLIGATLVYLQGETFATAFSGDRLSDRRTTPGVMQLVRWTIIREALAGGARAVALGGVDTPGHRVIPTGPLDVGWGLYQHKAGFGARWVWQTPARRILLRPRARLAVGLRAGRDAVRRWGPGLD